MTANTMPVVNPRSDEFHQNPFADYALLRHDAPVYRVEGEDWCIVSTMELCREVLRDPVLYSNERPSGRRSDPPPEIADEVMAIRAQGFSYEPTLNLSDPPIHTRYRKLVNRAFTPRSLAWMEPLVESVATSLSTDLPDGEVVDIIDAVTRPLPVWAILRILGLPEELRDDVVRWSNAATAALGAEMPPERWLQAERDMLDYQRVLAATLDERRVSPREDLLSLLVQTEDDEVPLTNAELVYLVRELIIAGNETTTRMLAETIVMLDGRPGVWDQMNEDPTSIRGIVEEGLRISSPAVGLFRRVTRDTELGGVHLPANTTLFLSYASANRDEEVFENADDFDPERKNLREHIAFGQGIHVCVGAGLARIEAAATLQALAAHVTALEVVDRDALRYGPSFVLRGLETLPVRVRRR